MYCSTEHFQYFFETLEFQQDENGVLLLDPSVRIYCNADVDAICAAEIFKKLFYLKHTIWSIKPVRNTEDFDIRDRQPSPLAKSIFIVLDNINSPENKDIIEKAKRKELAEKDDKHETVGGYLVITDDFGRPVKKHWSAIEKHIPLATGPARRCHTSLFVSKRINLVEYNKVIGFLDAEVMDLNNSDSVQRIHRHKAVPAHSDDKRIIRINEYPLYMITHRMAKQNFPNMDVQVANSLAEMIKEEGPKFGLEYPLYSSYCKFYGYKQPSLSASDAAYGLITLLSTKKSASIEFGVEVRWVSDFEDDDSWLNNFYTVMEALDSCTGTTLLQSGIDLRKVLQPLFRDDQLGNDRSFDLFDRDRS
ncbi:13767_t:CDS:2 [Cetraspora pellucida]|uniref:13767_t:CDS:1 n=1 Tax=Cetraspora pellucida TaxID=1433469 RepID=A0A9N9I6I5_9GLOM|nr:13767_t:CDS:2 [Cetraspora pellucida]